MKSLISGSEGGRVTRTLPPTPCFHSPPLASIVDSGKIFLKSHLLSTVKPLYKGHTWDMNFGPCREFGCFRRLFSITVITLVPTWYPCGQQKTAVQLILRAVILNYTPLNLGMVG